LQAVLDESGADPSDAVATAPLLIALDEEDMENVKRASSPD